MTRSIYGADGSAQVVSLTGIPTMASATVKSLRVGGVTVTDIQDATGAALAGVVTPDSRGQVLFLGPDNSTATYWLDFGDGGPRWAVRPVDTATLVSALIQADRGAHYATPDGTTTKGALPYINGDITQALTSVLDGFMAPRVASAAARDAKFAAPGQGDRCYRTDINAWQTYRSIGPDGNEWVTDPSLLRQITLSADSSGLFFSSITTDWKHLLIRYHSRMVGSTTVNTIASYLGVRLNNDSGTNYAFNGDIRTIKGVTGTITYEVGRDGTGGGTSSTTTVNYGSVGGGLNNFVGFNSTSAYVGIVPGSSNATGIFGGGEIRIDNYTSASFRKSMTGVSGFADNSGGAGTGYSSRAEITGGWSNNAAVNRIDFLPGSGTAFAAGSVFSLYGQS